jgi:hypothetical protein
MQIFASLPSQYAMILMVLQHRRPLPTPKATMHDLLEEEPTGSLSTKLEDKSIEAAIFFQHGGYHRCEDGGGGVRGGRGGRSGHGVTVLIGMKILRDLGRICSEGVGGIVLRKAG